MGVIGSLRDFLGLVPEGQQRINIGSGFSIWEKGFQPEYADKPESIKPLGIIDKNRNSHVMGTGTTRVGKSVLISQMVAQDIRLGNSCVIVDPKGDRELFTNIVQAAYEAGRKRNLILVTPIFPQYSAKISPLAYSFQPEERVHHIVSALESKDGSTDQFFLNIAYEITLVIDLSLSLLASLGGYHGVINVSTIKRFVSHHALNELKKELEMAAHRDPQRVGEVKAALEQVLYSPADYFAKVSSTLRTTLTALSTGSVGEIIGKAETNDFIRRLESDEPVILIVQTGAMLARKAAHMIARMIISMIQSFVARRLAMGRKCTPPLSVYLDEAASLMYPGIEELFSKSGQANCKVHVFTQSIADYAALVGLERARTILDCTNTKIFMSLNDPETCEYVSKSAGTISRLDHIFGGLGSSVTSREMEKYRIKPEDVSMLKPRQFFLFTKEGVFFGKTNFCRPPMPEELIKFPRVEVLQ